MVALATIFAFGIANAQLGVEAGYSNQNSTTSGSFTHPVLSIPVSVANTTLMNGFYVGAVYELNVQGPIGLSYGLKYNYLTGNSKTTTSTPIPTSATTDSVSTGHRLDLPVRIQAGFPIGGDIKLLAFAGPNFTMSLGQKVGNTNLADKMTKAGDKKMYNAFDIQLGGGVGVSYKMVTLKASYDWGLLNRNNETGFTTKANDLRIGLSYSF